MEIGFIGLGHMGFPMARRLIQANHRVVAFDTRAEALDKVAELGAQPASSPKEVADLAETVMASLPSPQVALDVATGANGVIEGNRVKRYVDLLTVGSQTAVRIHDLLAVRNIAAVDGPVSGGVSGAENRTLAVMVSGVQPGLDAHYDALNAGSGLMVKDVRLYLDEAKALGVPVEVAEAVGRLWETAMRDEGADSDFTSAIKPIERAAGVIVGPVGASTPEPGE